MDYVSFRIAFWNDPSVVEMAFRERYVFDYLITSPLLKLCGCYEITEKQIAYHTGLDEQSVHFAMVELADTHKRIGYDEETHEVFIINFPKWNWINSSTFYSKLKVEIDSRKSKRFRKCLYELLDEKGKYSDTVSIPYGYLYIRNILGLVLKDKDNTTTEEESTKEEKKPIEPKLDELDKVLAKYGRKPKDPSEMTLQELKDELERVKKNDK